MLYIFFFFFPFFYTFLHLSRFLPYTEQGCRIVRTGSPHSIFYLFLVLAVDVIDQALGADDFLHELRERLTFVLGSLCSVINDSAVKIHFHLISVFNGLRRLRTLDDGEPDIDGIAVKDSPR